MLTVRLGLTDRTVSKFSFFKLLHLLIRSYQVPVLLICPLALSHFLKFKVFINCIYILFFTLSVMGNNTTVSNSVFWWSGVFRCSGVFRGVPVFRCSGIPVCSGVPACSGVPVFRCSGVPGFSTCRKNLLQCHIGVLLRIAVMWWICPLSVYLCTTYLSLAIKQPFRENTTGQVGTDSSNSFSGSCDYISYLPSTSEYSLAETGNLCYIAVFWLSAARISFSRCLLVC